MRFFTYQKEAWDIFFNNFKENKKKEIEETLGLKENLYCTFITFLNKYVSRGGKHECTLYDLIKLECGVSLSKKQEKEVMSFLDEHLGEIEYV